jgi:peptidoglycan/LPS O-acetylase OafA/YrhL
MDRGTDAPVEVIRQALFIDVGARFINEAFWTLPVELRWYIVFPLALWLWTRSPRAFLIVATLALMAFITRAGNVDFLVLPAFMLGIVAADLHLRSHRLCAFALPVLVPIALIVLFQTPSGGLGFVSSFSEAAAFLFVVAAGTVGPLTRLLSIRMLTILGVASYSIYLVHYPVMALLQQHGVSPLASALAAVGGGLAFWWIAERPFVETGLRDRTLAQLAFIPKWLHAVGIGNALMLHGSDLAPAVVPRHEGEYNSAELPQPVAAQ